MSSLPIIVPIISTVFFGILAIVFSLKEEKNKKLLVKREENQKHQLYELTILKEIQDKTGYELDPEKIADVIIGSLRNLFSFSTASFLIIKNDKLVFKTDAEESVSQAFIEQVKKSMLASLTALTEKPLPINIETILKGSSVNNSNNLALTSFFHIPLIVSNNTVGLINVSSTKTGLYKESQMTILYQITSQASHALTRLQEILTTEKEKLMSLIGSLADGVFMLDTKNNLLTINDAARKIFNIPKKEVTLSDIVAAFPRQNDFMGKIQTSIQKNIGLEEKEVVLKDKYIQVFINPVLNSLNTGDFALDAGKQKVIGVSVLLQDITLEKNLNKMKDDFTNIIVHELRAPLAAVRGASTLLMSEDTERNTREKLTHIIHDESDKMLSEVSSLLDAAKLEAGRFVVDKKPEDLKKLIEEKIQTFSPQARNKNITLSSNISQSLPQIPVDAFRIGQVLNNLISNSLKFTPEGGKIIIKTMMADQESDNPKIITSVIDTGIGIPREKQNNLFNKFSQIARSQSTLDSLALAESERTGNQSSGGLGTGLGLYVAKGIVEAHKGTISLESEIRQGGTIVSFTLPLI